jgi:hypothetical protein
VIKLKGEHWLSFRTSFELGFGLIFEMSFEMSFGLIFE